MAEALGYLDANMKDKNYWIDMESGIRTDDWFDIEKIKAVCEIVAAHIN